MPPPSTGAPQPAVPEPDGWARLRARLDWRVLGAAVLVLLLGVWFDGRMRLAGLQKDLARELAASARTSQEVREIATETRQSMRDLEFKIGMLESRLSETQNQRLAWKACTWSCRAAAMNACSPRSSRCCCSLRSNCSWLAISRRR